MLVLIHFYHNFIPRRPPKPKNFDQLLSGNAKFISNGNSQPKSNNNGRKNGNGNGRKNQHKSPSNGQRKNNNGNKRNNRPSNNKRLYFSTVDDYSYHLSSVNNEQFIFS